MRSPVSKAPRKIRLKPAEEPVVTITRPGDTSSAVGVAIMPRDPLAQRPHAERLGIAEAAAAQHFGRGVSTGAGAAAPGWPTSMCTIVPPRRLQLGGGAITSMARNGSTVARLECALNITCLSFVAPFR